MKKGYFTLVLHAHLPYINHPDFSQYMEERWLFEGITETYLPLLQVFKRLHEKGIFFRISMSLTPPLMEMLKNKDLQAKYRAYLDGNIQLAEKEIQITSTEDTRKNKLAEYYLKTLKDIRDLYLSIDGEIIGALAEFQEQGYLEIITCNATHGFLPLMSRYPEATAAQIKVGVETYKSYIGKAPRGIWLAECGYVPELDEFLTDNKLNFFFVDSHALWYADPAPHYGVYRPVMTPGGSFAFARDPESSHQVWSAEAGYPGDPRYREFYRDIGFEREDKYIKPHIDPSGIRCTTGIKYHKITGKEIELDSKEYYNVEDAICAVREHAADFAVKKAKQIEDLYERFDGIEPIVVAPFDAELFGHWWYEGPLFIESFFEELAKEDSVIPATPTEVIASIDNIQISTPNSSTWGANGYNEVWLNGRNDWIYRHFDELMERMIALATEYQFTRDPLDIRLLNQLARELLLAQASDWAFIMTTGTTVEYAMNRTKTHIERFFELEKQLKSEKTDENYLSKLEWIDGIFTDIDYRIYRKKPDQ